MYQNYQTIVIGAGAGGLVVALGLASAGKKVLLIDRGTWGGDCTNFGCIPSKALIASSHAAQFMKNGEALGVLGTFSNGVGALNRVRQIVSDVRSKEDALALQKRGVDTLTGLASFKDPHTLSVGDEIVKGDRIVIATGSSPLIPAIEGLKDTPYLTNETLFDLQELPKSFCVIGGGPIGSELAQAFARLGSEVFQVHRHHNLLKREELEASSVIAEQLKNEGVNLFLGFEPQSVVYDHHFRLLIQSKDNQQELVADALLVAVGRRPNVSALNLDAARVSYSTKGIKVDRYGRSSQKHIFAIGDVTGGAQFTHVAENQARTVLTSLLLPIKKKMDTQFIPRATYTDPEVASFGLLEKEAKDLYGDENIAIYNVPMSENDRAITTGRTEGFVKVITKKMSSKILGGTIVGPRAGEMLPELSLAAKHKIPLRKLAQLIHPYPTYNQAIRRSGDLWLTQTFLPWLRHPLKGFPWKRFLPLFIVGVLMIIAYSMGLQRYINFEWLKKNHHVIQQFIHQYVILAPLVFICVYAFSTALSLPGGAILSLIGGYLFSIPLGTIYVLIGATTGACLIFLAAKTSLGEIFKRKAGPKLKKMEKGFQENAWSYLLFLRFVPLFPFWLVNIAPALFNVRFWTYLWTTCVGIIPGVYVFTQAGAGLGAIFQEGGEFSFETVFNWQLRIALIALGVFALAPMLIKKWRKHRG